VTDIASNAVERGGAVPELGSTKLKQWAREI